MKNCADSAAQAISIAAIRMLGAVQSTDHGPSSSIGSAARSQVARFRTETMVARYEDLYCRLVAR